MFKNTQKTICDKCKGQGVIEVFEPEVGFEVLVSCPEYDTEIEKSLKNILEGNL